MTTDRFDDSAPNAPRLTAYDEKHLIAYLRLLDADAEGADWRDAAVSILRVNIDRDPVRAKSMYDSHLARARWMTEVGYADLLGCGRAPSG